MDRIRLIRPLNLFIIALSLYVIKFGMQQSLEDNHIEFSIFNEINFFIVTVNMLVIAAAGYVINDIFDVSIDAINKPDKQIVSKSIPSEKAYKFYTRLIIFSFILTLYLMFTTNSFWLVTTFLILHILLFLYSKYLKKIAVIGNFIVAVATSSVAFVCLFFILDVIPENFVQLGNEHKHFSLQESIQFIAWALFIAMFLLNFSREIVKDLEDLEGDTSAQLKTLPIVSGVIFSKIIAVLPLIIYAMIPALLNGWIPYLFISLPAIVASIFILISKDKSQFKKASLAIKISMLLGLILIVILIIQNK